LSVSLRDKLEKDNKNIRERSLSSYC